MQNLTKNFFISGIITFLIVLVLSFPASSQGSAEAVTAAAEAGLEITQASIDGIWNATGMADKPYQYAFYVDTLKAGTADGDCHNNLQYGNDEICFFSTEKQRTTNENQYHITLEQPQGNWWKAIIAHKPPNTFSHEIVNVEADNDSKTVLLDYKDMFEYFIVMSRTGSAGAHTNAYWIQNSYDLKPTNDWTIKWNKD